MSLATTESIHTEVRNWEQEYLLRPYCKGLEKINQCILGIDFSQNEPRSLSLSQRVIFLFTGLLLMLPFINIIFLLAMEALWGEGLIPERSSKPENTQVSSSHAVSESLLPLETKQVRYISHIEGRGSELVKWTVKKFENQTFVEGKERDVTTRAIYDHRGILIYFVRSQGSEELIAQRRNRTLTVIRTIDGSVVKQIKHDLAPEIPWVQQPAIDFSFKQFIASNETKFECVHLHIEMLSLHGICAEKENFGDQSAPLSVVLSAQSWTDHGALNAGRALFGIIYPVRVKVDAATQELLEIDYSEPKNRNDFKQGFHTVRLRKHV